MNRFDFGIIFIKDHDYIIMRLWQELFCDDLTFRDLYIKYRTYERLLVEKT